MKSEFEETHKTLLVMAAEALGLEAALHGPVADYLARWLAAQYAVAASEQLAGLEGEPRVKVLRAFIHDTALLRRGDQNAERLRVASRDADLKWKRKIVIVLESLIRHIDKHPEAKAAME